MAHPVIAIEAAIFVVLLVAGIALRERTRHWAERALARLARLLGSPPLAAFVIALAVAAATSAVRPPTPSVHDELSYLLAAETYASGRLTNPPHPMWRHFETFHVLQQPTYQSRYPPGQALAMALGKLVGGHYIVGVWIALATASAAVCWALQFWLPARWALFGALLPALRFGGLAVWDLQQYAQWSTTYWGGGLALAGGALALGGAARLWRSPGLRPALLFAAGLGLLACTRPYEGVWLGAPLTAMSLWGCLRERTWRPVAAGAAVLAATAAFLTFYNVRVTGSPFKIPYTEYAKQYDVVPAFRFQALKPEPVYRHDVLRRYHTSYRVNSLAEQSAGWGVDRGDFEKCARFFLGLLLAPVFVAGLFWRSGWTVFSVLLLSAGVLSHVVVTASALRPHYFAPFVPALILLTVQGVRVIKAWRVGRMGPAAAQALVVAMPLSWAAGAALRAFAYERYPNVYEAKSEVVQRLLPADARHLVFVHYGPEHFMHAEWVYNAANLDDSAVVWARTISPEEDRKLISYYPDRIVWNVWADEVPPRLELVESPPLHPIQ